MNDPTLPQDLPEPVDDGAADRLTGMRVPTTALETTAGDRLDLAAVPGRWILFVYPSMRVPGQPLPEGWDTIPGARGCTPEACGFRDEMAALGQAGLDRVYGLSVQAVTDQRELAAHLGLPYDLVSDPALTLADSLRLPTFEAEGTTFYRRLTMVVRDGVIERVFYPVFPPDDHARRVAEQLSAGR